MNSAGAVDVGAANGAASPRESMLRCVCAGAADPAACGAGASLGIGGMPRKTTVVAIFLEVISHMRTLHVNAYGGSVEIKILNALER